MKDKAKECIFMCPMTKEEQELEKRRLLMAVKYGMGVTFYDGSSDEDLCDIPDNLFKSITLQFDSGTDYYNNVLIASKYTSRGLDVPEELWSKICQTRQDYNNYIKKGGKIK